MNQANGGTVVQLEKTADVRIVDHARKEALPGTYVKWSLNTFFRNA